MKKTRLATQTLFALSLAVFGFTPVHAQESEDITKTDAYANVTYTWTDSETGIEITSSILEAATKLDQMKALITQVWLNQNLPGTISLSTSSSNTVSVSYKVGKERTSALPSTTTYKEDVVNYYGSYGTFPETTSEEVDVLFTSWTKYTPGDATPNKHGVTALIVEMVDDWTGGNIDDSKNIDVTDDNFNKSWSYIKSIQVIPLSRQLYVDNGENSGYLVNIHQPLNKFFVMLKGNPYDGSTVPFFDLYEQLAAQGTDNPYVENAYEKMLNGSKFSVEHNCYSVTVRGHSSMLRSKEDTEPINPNMLLFIPDRRFWGKANDLNHYSSSYLPYYFVYAITLEQDPELTESDYDATENVYNVPLTWTSEQKLVTKDNLTEEFMIWRSYDDGATWTLVPAEDITLQDEYTSLDGDNVDRLGSNYDSSVGLVVSVTVREDKPTDTHKVLYRVDGRVDGANFDYVNSNVVEVILPGNDYSEPLLRIDLVHMSDFAQDGMCNEYENTVGSLWETLIPVTNQNITDDTKWYVRRYANKNVDAPFTELHGDLVATISFVRGTEADNVQPVDVTISYADGRTETTAWYAPTDVDADQQIFKNTDNSEYLFKAVDKFSVSVADAADDNRYEYRLFAKDFANTDPQYTSFSSNREGVTMPGNWTGTGYITYTLAEIQNDLDHALESSSTAPRIYIPYNDSRIDYLDVRLTDNSGASVIKAWRGQGGEYSFNQFDADGKATPLTAYTTVVNFTGYKDLPASKAFEGEEILLVTYCEEANDHVNTYGSPKAVLPEMPTLHFANVDMALTENLMGYNIQGEVYVDYNGQEDLLNHFGYGFWRDDTQIKKAPTIGYEYWYSTIIGDGEGQKSQLDFDILRHHHGAGGDAAASDQQFHFQLNSEALYSLYSTGVVTETGDGGFADNVTLDHLATKDEPATGWFHARQYANVLDENGEATDRYILIQTSGGWRNDGNLTTGVDGVDADNMVVKGVTGGIQVDGTDLSVSVYNLAGEAVYSGPAGFIATTPGVYMVSVADKHFKVMAR